MNKSLISSLNFNCFNLENSKLRILSILLTAVFSINSWAEISASDPSGPTQISKKPEAELGGDISGGGTACKGLVINLARQGAAFFLPEANKELARIGKNPISETDYMNAVESQNALEFVRENSLNYNDKIYDAYYEAKEVNRPIKIDCTRLQRKENSYIGQIILISHEIYRKTTNSEGDSYSLSQEADIKQKLLPAIQNIVNQYNITIQSPQQPELKVVDMTCSCKQVGFGNVNDNYSAWNLILNTTLSDGSEVEKVLTTTHSKSMLYGAQEAGREKCEAALLRMNRCNPPATQINVKTHQLNVNGGY